MCPVPAREPWTNGKSLFLHWGKRRAPKEEFLFYQELCHGSGGKWKLTRRQGHLKRVLSNGADILKLMPIRKGIDSFQTVTSGTPAYNCKIQDELHARTVDDRWKIHLTYSPVWDSNPYNAWGIAYSNASPPSSSNLWLGMQSPEPERLPASAGFPLVSFLQA